MKTEYKDFIGIYHDVFEPNFCEHMISQFDILQKNSVGINRLHSENAQHHFKSDYQIFWGLDFSHHHVSNFNNNNPKDYFFSGLQSCFDAYSEKYSILKTMGMHSSSMKMQKSVGGDGYHVWHCEQGPGEASARSLVYIFYMNTIEPEYGGETEFLYQKQRYSPKQNTMLIFPAAYTHTHRGNPVLSDELSKYIITGWFYLDR